MIDIEYYRTINNDAKNTTLKENHLRSIHKYYEEDFHKNPDYQKNSLLNGIPTELLVIDKENYPKIKYVKSRIHQKLLVGDIVETFLDNENNKKIYMITDVDSNTEKLNQGKMEEITWKLSWIGKDKDSGKNKVFHSYCLIANATQYNSGEYDGKFITVGTSQFAVFFPSVYETVMICKGQRFLISKNNENPIAYKVSSIDHVSYNYTSKGLVRLMLEEDFVNHKVDNTELMIADYWKDKENNVSNLEEVISNNPSNNIIGSIGYSGELSVRTGNEKIFNAIFKDSDGNIIQNVTPIWKKTMIQEIGQSYVNFIENQLEITVKIDRKFPLSALPFQIKLELFIQEDSVEIKKDEVILTVISLFG